METLTSVSLKQFQSVIFDLDGTLFDTAADILSSLQDALLAEGHLNADTSRLRLGPPLEEMIRLTVGDSVAPEAIARISAAFRNRYDHHAYPNTQSYPGLQPLLLMLRDSGVTLHVATNKRQAPTLRILEIKGVRSFFQHILCVDSGGEKYSKTAMIEEILRRSGQNRESALIIGDTGSDIRAGREAGIRTVGVLYGYAEAGEIFDAAPDFVCASLTELL